MNNAMYQALASQCELFAAVILRYWDKDQTLDEWVDAEMLREDFDRKYGDLRFLMREALAAQVSVRALAQD
jgi:hypothetical protein